MGKMYDPNNNMDEGKGEGGDDGVQDTGNTKRDQAHHTPPRVPSRLETLAAVHYRYWRVEQVLELYFALMGAIPASKQPLMDFFQSGESDPAKKPPMSGKTNLGVLRAVLAALEFPLQGERGRAVVV